MIISLIAAISINNVIGYKNTIPWKLYSDFEYFKRTTMGHCIIMGQNTYESIGKALPGRTNIVLTLAKNYNAKDCIIAFSIKEALRAVKNKNEKEVFVIGGASVYKQFIGIADKLYITKVHHKFKGDTYFPEIDGKFWKMISSISHKKDSKNRYDFDFEVFTKRKSNN